MDIPRLHPDTIEAIKQRLDIVDIVSEQVVLRRRGKDYLGLCPFHEEKTPSFTVSPSKQMYYCFGCGAGGNAIKFLMETSKRNFGDVMLDLARRYQVPVKTLEPEQRQELQRQLSLREQLYEILAIAARFFQHALYQPQGETARRYLLEQRQFSEAAIQQFGLGYAPAGWETLYRYLVEVKQFPVQLVAQAGLIRPRQRGEGYYDYFRDRVAIPICDLQGRVIGFGTRTLGNDEPKYLNSPETPLFNKGETLYALDRARGAIAKQDRAIVVEGYFDAIALHAAGIENAVASLGTALSQAQVKQLLRYTESKQIVFNFDADRAGIQATQRAIGELEDLVYSGQVQLRILNLPGGKDADEFLQSSPDAVERYRQAVEQAPLWLDWQIQQLVAGKDLKQADQFEPVAQQMVKLLNKLTDANKRTHYTRYCAEVLSQGDVRLVPSYSQTLQRQLRRPQVRTAKEQQAIALKLQASAERNLLEQAEALLLLIYLHSPASRRTILQAMEEKDLLFSLAPHRILWQQILDAPPERDRDLVAYLQETNLSTTTLAEVAYLFHLNEKQMQDIRRAPLLIRAAIAALERVTCEKHRQYCLEQWQQLDPQQEPEKWRYYSEEFYAMQRRVQELDRERQISIFDLVE